MSETQTASRTVEGVTLPPVGTYAIDKVHSDLSFVARHLMVAKVRGHFRSFEGTIEVAEVPEESRVTATIDAASVDTNEPNRDNHIRSADFLDAEHYPTITFESTGLVRTGGTTFDLPGLLTIRGITHPVTLHAEFNGVTEHPQMGTRIGLSATTEVARDDWGVSFNAALETGGFMVSKTIRLELEVQATAQH
ncbi:MAG TPA: YceI family protein [Actinomycetota bacterium]|nr:YceI family protein [Actinomycetota bacterium]